MKIIIVGLGKVGYAIAQQMVGEEHDLILEIGRASCRERV